jgi:hypothetical protein
VYYIDGVNLFVDVRYDQERNAIACLFQNQPLDIIKECAVFKTGRQPKRRYGYSTSFVAINNTSLNTNCFEEVRVEARSGVHTPVSVIIDTKEGSCLKAASASLSKFAAYIIYSINNFSLYPAMHGLNNIKIHNHATLKFLYIIQVLL